VEHEEGEQRALLLAAQLHLAAVVRNT